MDFRKPSSSFILDFVTSSNGTMKGTRMRMLFLVGKLGTGRINIQQQWAYEIRLTRNNRNGQ
ncbi:hypothetical protein MTR_3g026910 [Medicago truncatula]|uniref:Uncharacterized protein n=1 Tax=Medicago truncatula TaxID=3880 RepID=G8A202_MEDTR|nr:hypothetical protein MTR_3g026910 [Medicago truncatula]